MPVRPVLSDRVRICRDAGNESGSGVDKLFESRCSSASEESEEIDEGMTPEIEVDERSLCTAFKKKKQKKIDINEHIQ